MIESPPYKSLPQDPTYTPWLRWLNQAFNVLLNTQFYGITEYQAPSASGFSYQIGSSTGILILDPVAAYAVGTAVLPAAPRDQRQIQITTTQSVTAFTLTDPAGYTVKNAPATLTAGQAVSYVFNKANTTWYRTQ
jgi:hypothetical protein